MFRPRYEVGTEIYDVERGAEWASTTIPTCRTVARDLRERLEEEKLTHSINGSNRPSIANSFKSSFGSANSSNDLRGRCLSRVHELVANTDAID